MAGGITISHGSTSLKAYAGHNIDVSVSVDVKKSGVRGTDRSEVMKGAKRLKERIVNAQLMKGVGADEGSIKKMKTVANKNLELMNDQEDRIFGIIEAMNKLNQEAGNKVMFSAGGPNVSVMDEIRSSLVVTTVEVGKKKKEKVLGVAFKTSDGKSMVSPLGKKVASMALAWFIHPNHLNMLIDLQKSELGKNPHDALTALDYDVASKLREDGGVKDKLGVIIQNVEGNTDVPKLKAAEFLKLLITTISEMAVQAGITREQGQIDKLFVGIVDGNKTKIYEEFGNYLMENHMGNSKLSPPHDDEAKMLASQLGIADHSGPKKISGLWFDKVQTDYYGVSEELITQYSEFKRAKAEHLKGDEEGGKPLAAASLVDMKKKDGIMSIGGGSDSDPDLIVFNTEGKREKLELKTVLFKQDKGKKGISNLGLREIAIGRFTNHMAEAGIKEKWAEVIGTTTHTGTGILGKKITVKLNDYAVDANRLLDHMLGKGGKGNKLNLKIADYVFGPASKMQSYRVSLRLAFSGIEKISDTKKVLFTTKEGKKGAGKEGKLGVQKIEKYITGRGGGADELFKFRAKLNTRFGTWTKKNVPKDTNGKILETLTDLDGKIIPAHKVIGSKYVEKYSNDHMFELNPKIFASAVAKTEFKNLMESIDAIGFEETAKKYKSNKNINIR